MTKPAYDQFDELPATLAVGWRMPSNNPHLEIQDGLIFYYPSNAEYPQRHADEELAALEIARDLAAMPDEPEWEMYCLSCCDFPDEYGRPDFRIGSFLDRIGEHLGRGRCEPAWTSCRPSSA